jgi:hypothetical protein
MDEVILMNIITILPHLKVDHPTTLTQVRGPIVPLVISRRLTANELQPLNRILQLEIRVYDTRGSLQQNRRTHQTILLSEALPHRVPPGPPSPRELCLQVGISFLRLGIDQTHWEASGSLLGSPRTGTNDTLDIHPGITTKTADTLLIDHLDGDLRIHTSTTTPHLPLDTIRRLAARLAPKTVACQYQVWEEKEDPTPCPVCRRESCCHRALNLR